MRIRTIRLLVIAAAIFWFGDAHAAIAGSKLGRFISEVWSTQDARSDDVLLRKLREGGLVRPDVPDDTLMSVFRGVREAHLAPGHSPFDGPASENIRVGLGPYLSEKGRMWAEPLKSLDSPDNESDP